MKKLSSINKTSKKQNRSFRVIGLQFWHRMQRNRIWDAVLVWLKNKDYTY